LRAGEWLYVADELHRFAYSTNRGWVVGRGSEVGILTLASCEWWEMQKEADHASGVSILQNGQSGKTVDDKLGGNHREEQPHDPPEDP
jgi:hypothetical protein